uniref:Putative mitochondrial nadh-ubiquinone oxidoreductase chain 5 n=1 Tax=Ixodes ricinus TaxID=34613 RepID=A0A0K8RDN3_IXORI
MSKNELIEETGVGAAIAAGNHAEKGICALLVVPEIKIKIPTNFNYFFRSSYIYYFRSLIKKITDIITVTSPTRFIKTVIIPKLNELMTLIKNY